QPTHEVRCPVDGVKTPVSVAVAGVATLLAEEPQLRGLPREVLTDRVFDREICGRCIISIRLVHAIAVDTRAEDRECEVNRALCSPFSLRRHGRAPRTQRRCVRTPETARAAPRRRAR